ncbi:DUF2905 domain-containing protein [Brevibacillus migulae]|uniref:DUF2905 domain-containing protein n=1 Tax=Brevibacillus migulae TaxID=1644114 RepID=UPI00106E265F|nr:DUF2905 domain-containing protein [Brevibacillus migulae]
MNPVAKLLIIGGVILVIIGIIWQVGGRFIPFGRLPGDIAVEKDNFRFYFPVVTCIVISIVLSLISYLFRLFK